MQEIELKHVGPLERLTIPVPEGGGVIVLTGRNGQGKSIALDAVRSLMSGGTAPVQDGASTAQVTGLGASIKVGRKTTRKGEIVVEHLDGVDPTDLVDPGLKDPVAADAARIRALCTLAGAKADWRMFSGLVPNGDSIAEMLAEEDLSSDDLPTLAGKIKRAFEAQARKHEKESAGLIREAEGIKATIPAGAENVEADETALAALTEETIRRLAQIEERAREASRRKLQAAQANEALALIPEPDDPDKHAKAVEAAVKGASAAAAEVTAADDALEAAKQAMAVANERSMAADAKLEAAIETQKMAEASRSQRATLIGIIEEASQFEAIDPKDLVEAREERAEAQRAQEAGAVARHCAAQAKRIKDLQAKAEKIAETSEAYRNAAAETETVLSEAIAKIAPKGLRVQQGNLVLDYPKRGVIRLAELSKGEAWPIAIDIAIDALGEGGILVIRQEAWEGLDPETKLAVHEHARARKTVILTAQADSGTIRAEVFEGVNA